MVHTHSHVLGSRVAAAFVLVALGSYLGGCLESRSGRVDDASPSEDTVAVPDTSGSHDTLDTTDTIDTASTRDTTETAGTPDSAGTPDTQDGPDTVDSGVSEPDTRPPACPVAIIDVLPGTEIRPGTVLELDGRRSYGDGVPIVDYRWEVDQPNGSCEVYTPSANVRSPTLLVRVSGVYRIRLRVTDARGRESCEDAEAWVYANPTEAIRIELLWWAVGNDPGWPLTAGPDLDLHFAHPYTRGVDGNGDGLVDGWFDETFDTFWANPSPNWGRLDPSVADDPELVTDAVWGCGPEALAFGAPEAGTTYRVGVHFWEDHGFTEVMATVRIYVYGTLVFEVLAPLVEQDMWEVAQIHWSDTPSITMPKRCQNSSVECSRDSDCGQGDVCSYDIISDFDAGVYAP